MERNGEEMLIESASEKAGWKVVMGIPILQMENKEKEEKKKKKRREVKGQSSGREGKLGVLFVYVSICLVVFENC